MEIDVKSPRTVIFDGNSVHEPPRSRRGPLVTCRSGASMAAPHLALRNRGEHDPLRAPSNPEDRSWFCPAGAQILVKSRRGRVLSSSSAHSMVFGVHTSLRRRRSDAVRPHFVPILHGSRETPSLSTQIFCSVDLSPMHDALRIFRGVPLPPFLPFLPLPAEASLHPCDALRLAFDSSDVRFWVRPCPPLPLVHSVCLPLRSSSR